MKCNRCPNAATLHITEIISEDNVEELHLCEECAHRYLSQPQPSGHGKAAGGSPIEDLESHVQARECELCGIKFVDFRNTHRLGCPNDYTVFREELVQLLEKIHGETRHCGKIPRRQPQSRQTQAELMQLRKQLLQAVHKEAYEDAARLRDRIKKIEDE